MVGSAPASNSSLTVQTDHKSFLSASIHDANKRKGERLTNPNPNLLDLLARLSIGDVYVDSSMQRGVCVGSILVVDVDLEVRISGSTCVDCEAAA